MTVYNFHRYRKMQRVQDALIVLLPAILMLVGILGFFNMDWVPARLARVLVSFID